MMTVSKSKIETSTVLSIAGLTVSIVLAVATFSSAAANRNNIHDEAQDQRICRLEAVQGIGECKR